MRPAIWVKTVMSGANPDPHINSGCFLRRAGRMKTTSAEVSAVANTHA